MQDVNGALKSNCVDGTISVATMILHDFKNTGTFAFPGFGCRMLAAELRDTQRRADAVPDWFRNVMRSCFEDPTQ